ncbi:methylated-DNA--[protein]-cysteine S-methyltransferase [Cupriavidus basilensis]|uniref:methylated-DNA--[protein]-cysteine S-methyltransferase n=1 Tax=Cupriavidus basilensis TaxID=68895 RepID=UPI0039F66492
MRVRSFPTFKYNFRTPGTRVEGPIRFAVGQTLQGMVLVGQSQRGICAILLGKDAPALRDQLAEAFPNIELRADESAFPRELNQVIAFIERGHSEGGVTNLDIGGTTFQQRVWRVLVGIPSGQTRSYMEVAQDLGGPAAVRAVAGACAANVLAIVIPCHRVVRSDGSVSGYRWGVERKLAMLAEERAQ